MVQQTREAGRVMSAASISVSKVLDGMDSHLYIRFSAYPDGRLMTVEPNKDTKYIGVVSTKENRPPTDPARYLWVDFKGEDGQETFVWMRYSEQNNGLPKMETSPTAKTQYMGVYSGPSNNPPVNPSDYKWVKTKGEQGEASYLHIRYSDYADGRDFYEKPRKTTMYIGIAVTVSKAAPPNKEAYDWAEFGANIEFGGRNYILESKEPKEIKKSGTVQWETLYGASKFAQDWLGYHGFAVITFNAQTFGTMKNKPIKFRIVGLNGTDRIYTENFEIPIEDIQKERFTYSYVLEVTERAKNATSFIIEVERWNHDFAMEITTVKLERGNRPTDWSAAPEDVNSEMMEIKKDTASLEVLIQKLESGKANTAELKALANELSGYVKSNTSYGGVKITDEGVLLDSTNMEVVLDGRRGFIVRRKNPALTIMEVNASGEFNIQASNLNVQVEEAKKEVENINKTKVQSVNMEYYLSTSTTSLVGGSWQGTAPTWVDGKYMWSRTKTVYGDGTVKYTPSENGTCIAGAKGKDGSDGVPGKDGVGLKDTVIHYAISSSGTQNPSTGWTSSVPTLEKGKYLWTRTVWHYTDNSKETGYSVTYISKDGNSGSDGLPGKDGVGIEKTTIEYAASKSGTVKPSSGWSTSIPTVPEGDFLWTRTTWFYTDKTSEQGFSVAKMGEKGGQGIQGPPGKDGQPTYTWIKYADSPTSGMSDSPTNKKYIGIAYNKTTPNKSSSYGDYQWSLIKGADGIPGKNGADGKPKYTWIVYADDIKGSGISHSSEGKGYMGIAYNKDAPTPVLTPSLYQWVELIGALEFGGRNYIRNSATWHAMNSNNGPVYPLEKGTDAKGNWVRGYHNDKPDVFYVNAFFPKLEATTHYSKDAVDLIGETVTFSVDLMSEKPLNVRISGGKTTLLKEGVWTRVHGTRISNDRAMFVSEGNTAPSTTKLYHRNWKLEKSNRPTDWSPAPEDVDAQVKEVETKFNARLDVQSKEISAAVSKSNANAKEIGQLKVRSDKIETEVSKKVEISKVNEAILANERIIDTRTRNDNPNYYYTNYKSRKVREFKNTSTVGLPNDGTYAVVETDVKWSDTSGGQISQVAQTDKATYQRFSTSTTAWGPWRKTADMNDINSVKTQITQLADNINARIVERDKIIAQINLSKEGILIQGKNIHLDGNTKINNGIIKNAHIQTLDAGKVNFGTLSGIMISGANSQWNLKDGRFKMTTPGNASQYIQIQNGSFKSFNGSTKTIEIQSDELAATSGGNSIRLNPQRLLFTGEGYKRTIDLTSQGLTVSSLVQDTGTGHFLNAGLEIESKGTQAYIDFRTNGRKNDYDSRIKSVGGNNTDGQGTLELEAKNIDSMAQIFRFRNAQTINFNGALADNLPKNLISTAIAADNSVLSIEKAGSHTNHYFNFRMRGLNHGVKDWGVSTWASDEKLKANIEDTHMNGLGIVNEFRVREFNWKAGGHEPIGLIAQEVEKVLPNAVFQNLGDIRQLKPEAFIPVLIKAIQELSEKTQVLNQQIVELQLQRIREQIQQTTEKGEIQ